jgi:hypothetical protein
MPLNVAVAGRSLCHTPGFALVRQRTLVIGIRMALDATTPAVRGIVLGRGLAIAAVGISFGLAGALAAKKPKRC